MRGVIVASTLFIIAVAGIVGSQYILYNQSEKMVVLLSEATEMVEKEKWDEALDKTNEIMDYCENDLKWLEILINHNETDEIRNTVHQLKEYMKYREVPELMATAASLKGEFEHIFDKERVVFENIF